MGFFDAHGRSEAMLLSWLFSPTRRRRAAEARRVQRSLLMPQQSVEVLLRQWPHLRGDPVLVAKIFDVSVHQARMRLAEIR